MRILSLLPAATEIIFLLGLEKNLVGVTDDCDYPPGVKKIPKLTDCLAKQFLTSREIDQKVKDLGHMGMSIAHLDEKKLEELKPDLILTQDLCKVCAVSYSQVSKAARVLKGDVKIISLEPESIGDILNNILLIGKITNKEKQATTQVEKLKKRLKILDSKFLTIKTSKPAVLVLEWLDPLMVAGHWVPEMVERAGGKMLITSQGEKSKYISFEEINSLHPDIVIIAPCGFSIKRTLKERLLIDDIRSKIIGNSKFFLLDGNAYLTRPGPRIINGIEILAEVVYSGFFSRSHTINDWIEYT